MIINRVLFLAFLTVVNSFCVLGAAATAALTDSSTSIPFVFDSGKISCIHILPITQVDETEVPEGEHAKGAVGSYKDTFGKDTLFESVSFDDTATDQAEHLDMMKNLVSYTTQYFCKDEIGQSIAPKNTCMVRIVITIDDGSKVEYHCGLYVSGFDNYQRGTIEDYLLHPGEKKQHKDLRDLSCMTALQRLASVENTLSVVGKFSGIITPEGKKPVDIFMDNRHRYMYSLPYFSFRNSPFYPSSWFFQAKIEGRETPDNAKDYAWLRKIMKERLFFTSISLVTKLKEPKTALECLKLMQEKRDKEYKMDDYCIALFDRLGPDTEPTSKFSCFRTDKVKDADSGGLPYYFNDSEQVFLSFLQLAAKEEGDSLETIRMVTPKYEGKSERIVTSISLNFYSFFDMCRFCRGTLSQVLSNGFLHTHLTELLTKEKVSMNGKTPINIYAFGFDRNVNKGDK